MIAAGTFNLSERAEFVLFTATVLAIFGSIFFMKALLQQRKLSPLAVLASGFMFSIPLASAIHYWGSDTSLFVIFYFGGLAIAYLFFRLASRRLRHLPGTRRSLMIRTPAELPNEA